MLSLDIIDAHGKPIRINAVRIVVRDSVTNTPIAIALEYAPSSFLASSAGEPDFAKLLKSLRIDDTLIVDHRSINSVPRIE